MSPVLLAIHLPDNVITNPWCVGGFVGMALMLLLGAWRIRDEEIPRVAVLTAAFFVASQIHVPLPGSTAHLLLNGLVGVVLGRRAGLAIPIGLFLQMALFQHGGWTTFGVNSCVMGVPALLAWLQFAGLRRLPWIRRTWFRGTLVAASVVLFVLSAAYAVTLLATNALDQEGLNTEWANRVTFHPGTLAAALALAMLAAWVEWRLANAPEFPLGLVVGETAVLATVLLNSAALLFGAVEPTAARTPALVLCVIYLPLAVVEGAVLGFLVGFLVRVKPEMIGWHEQAQRQKEKGEREPVTVAMLIALGCLVLNPWSIAHAHRLKSGYKVTGPNTVQVESWFDTGGSPKSAAVQVLRLGGELLIEGKMDVNGIFIFRFEDAETLKVVVAAGDGHRSEIEIPATALKMTPRSEAGESRPATNPQPLVEKDSAFPIRDVLLGVTFLLALSAFVLALRNARRR
jgi:ABC-type Co2+ transport system permease subunit